MDVPTSWNIHGTSIAKIAKIGKEWVGTSFSPRLRVYSNITPQTRTQRCSTNLAQKSAQDFQWQTWIQQILFFHLIFCASFPGCSQDVRRMFPTCSSDVPRMFAASPSVFVTFHSIHDNQKTNGFGKHVVIDCLDMSFGEFIFPEADVQHRV